MSNIFKAVVLDAQTLGKGINPEPLNKLPVEWTYYQGTTTEQTVGRLVEANIVLTNKVIIDQYVMEQCPRLKYIGVLATGTNNVDLAAAEKRGIVVRNVEAYCTQSVVQHTMAMMLSLAISLPSYSSDCKKGLWARSEMFCRQDHPILQLSGKTLLIVGSGTLGTAVARAAEAFGMKILNAEVPGSPSSPEGKVNLDQGLAEADVVSLHCPLTPQTDNMIDYRRLQLMKPHALLINAGRGGLVNEADLARALKSGEIGGAGVDVLTQEPPRDGNPLLDEDLPNLVITPHTAWASPEARQKIVDLSAAHLGSYLEAVV